MADVDLISTISYEPEFPGILVGAGSLCVHSLVSPINIRGAILFAQEAGKLEKNFLETGDHSQGDHYIAYVMGSILGSHTYIEALANECFIRVRRESSRYWHSTSKLNPAILEDKEDKEDKEDIFFKKVIKEKYRNLLNPDICGEFKEKLFGQEPGQSVLTTHEIRNLIVHPKIPYTSSEPKKRSTSSEKDLPHENAMIEPHEHETVGKVRELLEKNKKNKISENPFTVDKSQAYFPFKCLSYSCAVLSIKSAVKFSRQFFEFLDLNEFIPSSTIEDEARELCKNVKKLCKNAKIDW